MSVCLSVCLKLKISVTAEPIGFYSSGNIPTGPVVVLGFLFWGWDDYYSIPIPRGGLYNTSLGDAPRG